MTQKELADGLGIQQGTVSKHLRGEHLPTGLVKKMYMEKYPDIYKRILQIYEERKIHGTDND